MDNNYLQHYGVLGMKWGQRRAQRKLDRIEKKAKKQGWDDDATAAARLKTKKVSQMSNAELKKLNERIRLENEYKNLNKRDTSAGKKFVADIMKETSKEIAKDYTKKYAKKGIELVSNLIPKD